MVLILCIGDLHIPHRSSDLPSQFKELLKPGKIHSILCTGNLCSKAVLEYLRSISSDVTIVQGDFDEFVAPEHVVVKVGEFKIGVVHGHQVIPAGSSVALSCLHRQLGVDILVTGHTHAHKIERCEDGLQVTIGSATGAYSCFPAAGSNGSSTPGEPVPSFVLLDVDGPKANVYVYQLLNGRVKVDRIDYTKPTAQPAAGGVAPPIQATLPTSTAVA